MDVNNTSGLKRNQIKDLLLEKEKFWTGTLVTQNQVLNSTHDWNHSKRTEREKINNQFTYAINICSKPAKLLAGINSDCH